MEKAPKTFQRQLLLYNLLIIICIACAVSFYNFNSYKQDVILSETSGSLARINNLSDRMELAYDEMINILLNCTDRKSLFISPAAYGYPKTPEDALKAVNASDILKDMCAISGYSQYIYKLTLYNNSFLLQAGSSTGSLDDADTLIATDWFAEKLENSVFPYTLFVVENPFSGSGNTKTLLPLVRKITGSASNNAWVFLGISPALFDTGLQTLPRECIAYIATADGEIISSVNGDRYDTSVLTQELLHREPVQGSFSTSLDGEKCIVTWHRQSRSGLLLYEVLPVSDISLDYSVIVNTILMIFLFCFVIGFSLSFLFSIHLGSPMKRLGRRLDLIAKGDFSNDPSIETEDEMGAIGRQINQMSSRISNLMDSRIRIEQEKKDLEIKMLQAQINPHFLYNTLDSIKWIATMQNNSGIVKVVTALSSLLKNMAKGFNEKVTLRQELDFLENYITIEKVRYIEQFDVETCVTDEALYAAKIIKLTLQPIVENAIFSGIEPSGRFGVIRIRAYAENNTLYITVRDNGIGISEDNIKKLLTDTSRITGNNMSGIGLPNVDRRIKLVYGAEYGLRIESEPDQYTLITISLPLEYDT